MEYEYEFMSTDIVNCCGADDIEQSVLIEEDVEVDVVEGRACLDESDSSKKVFCRIFSINERNRRVLLGSFNIGNTSPSQPWRVNPTLGVTTALNAVFRCWARPENGKGMVYTSFVVSPEENGKCICLTTGHSYKEDSRISPAASILGCFGATNVTEDAFIDVGFRCAEDPLVRMHAKGAEDYAFFEAYDAFPGGFYLPCSPEEVVNGLIASFTYPAITNFLKDAEQELVQGDHEHGIWELYKVIMKEEIQVMGEHQSKRCLFDMLLTTFKDSHSGYLICSPGTLMEKGDCRCVVRQTTLGGSNGGPACPTFLEGYFFAVHDSAKKSMDANEATSTDCVNFVEHYKMFVLPHLPGLDDHMWANRDLGPFKRWLTKHSLQLPDKKREY